jgi:hypothetical protein
MNYIIEDNYDFFKELNALTPDDVVDNKCMISHLPLSFNSVTLPCKHSFNYLPLYTELCLHNNNKNIVCPYCREVSQKFIPFIPLPNVKKRFGVNYPPKKCLPAPECTFLLKVGARKGLKCGNVGVINGEGVFCMKHQHHIKCTGQASEAGQAGADTGAETSNEWSAAMEQLSKDKSVVELKEMLREKGLKVGGVKKDLVKRLFL